MSIILKGIKELFLFLYYLFISFGEHTIERYERLGSTLKKAKTDEEKRKAAIEFLANTDFTEH
jgi:hypothetical protein